jgi:hypothetical protein
MSLPHVSSTPGELAVPEEKHDEVAASLPLAMTVTPTLGPGVPLDRFGARPAGCRARLKLRFNLI